MLHVLGLSDIDELAYRALVAMPSSDAAQLATRIGRHLVEAAQALASLERVGLVARSSSERDRYVASPPSVALAALAMEREEELRRARLEIEALTEAYRNTDTERSVGDVVDVVRGAQAVGQRFTQLQATATREVLGFVKAEIAVVSPEENVAEDAAVVRGVRYRIVVERNSFERPGFLTAVEESIRMGEEVRVVPRLPIRLLIVDRRIALVPLLSGAADDVGGLIVHRSGMLDALLALFDRVWDDGLDLGVDAGTQRLAEGPVAHPPDMLGDVDRRILALLLAGLTDQTIAHQLGLSLRTIQRRVHLLMRAAGAQTRLQLGYQAARRGWI